VTTEALQMALALAGRDDDSRTALAGTLLVRALEDVFTFDGSHADAVFGSM
jgi:hypothetical protein